MDQHRPGRELKATRRRRAVFAMPASLLVLSCLLFGSSLKASAATLERVLDIVPGYLSSTFTKDMPIADFDDDGLPDIVVLGSVNYSDVIQIVGFQKGQGWKIKQTIIPEFTFDYDPPKLGDLDECRRRAPSVYPRQLFQRIRGMASWPRASRPARQLRRYL
jgi:hypothetical protein